ncbi:MAG: DUF1564 domain-containing protein [Leptospira sp.]|nr:DUF1564 domain-containing protein [Leptospira sp.]
MKINSKIIETTLLIKNQSSYLADYRKFRKTASCFRIPKKLSLNLYPLIGGPARVDEYLHKLLNKYRILCYSGSLVRFDGEKLKYQKKNHEWDRADFRPYAGDWTELRILSSMHGMTMTKFFVMLAELDMETMGAAMENALEGVDPALLLNRPIQYKQFLFKNKGYVKKNILFGKKVHRFKWRKYF